MSDRRQELLRQQALLREHLSWLDKELARETGPASPAPSVFTPDSRPTPTTTPQTPIASPADADALLSNYAAAERHDPNALRRGCFVVFGIALGILVLGVVAVYFLRYAGR